MTSNENNGTSKRVVLVVTAIASFVTPFISASINVALPSIGQEFALNAVLLSWVVSAYILSIAVSLMPLGRVADIYGRRKIFIYGSAILTVASIASALAPNTIWLLMARVLQGISSGMTFGIAVAILLSTFPARERGRVLGINIGVVYTGLSLGPVVGGLLTQHLGWRSIFWLHAILCLIVTIVGNWKIKSEWAEARGEPFDIIGSLIYGLTLVAIVYSLSLIPAASGIWLLIAGIAGLALFIIWESRNKSPILNINLFRHNTVFALSSLAALINYSATFAVGFLLSLYLQYIKGFDPQHAGLILVAQPVVMAIVAPFAGRLSDRVEPRLVSSVGMALTTTGLVLLIFLNELTSIVYVMLSLAILGLGSGLFSSPNTNAVMSSVDTKFYGVASGIVGTMRTVGQMLSLGIATVVFAVYIGRVQITPQYYPLFLKSTHTAFIIFALLCFGGIFASLARGKTRMVKK